MIYADYNATAPLRPEARAAMAEAMDIQANPSSVHGAGRTARKVLETARRQIGEAIGVSAKDIVFTSGGTEANALVLHGVVRALDGKATLYISAIEHEAVTQNAGLVGAPIRSVPVTSSGIIDLEALSKLLADHSEADGTPILALMQANNETGVIQPVAEAAAIVREAGGLVHCDAVQGLGKIPVNALLLGPDYIALSAHKCGGPQGVGALWVRAGAPLKPVQLGGGQERSLRSGTENLIGIAGFGAAAAASVEKLDDFARLGLLRDAMEDQLIADGGVTIFGRDADRLPNTSSFGFKGFRSDTQVMAMDLAGICISAGAACSSGRVSQSLVLGAMGVESALASSAIRTSYGWKSAEKDFAATANAWLKARERANLVRSG
ncbi:MAG: cysteine desulfurase family protein [Pseudomonadota bacterium]